LRKMNKNVHLRAQRVFSLNRNRCSPSSGMGVQVCPEYAKSTFNIYMPLLCGGGILVTNVKMTNLKMDNA